MCYLCRLCLEHATCVLAGKLRQALLTVCASSPVAPPCPVRSGVYNDLGSGSNVDLCIITADGVEYLRNHEMLQGKTYSRQFPVRYPPGTARECIRRGPWGHQHRCVTRHSNASACL